MVTFILQTIDPGNLAMRKTCLQSSMAALKEIARIFPMVALNDPVTRLAIGDAIGEINSASIRVYDMQRLVSSTTEYSVSHMRSFFPLCSSNI